MSCSTSRFRPATNNLLRTDRRTVPWEYQSHLKSRALEHIPNHGPLAAPETGASRCVCKTPAPAAETHKRSSSSLCPPAPAGAENRCWRQRARRAGRLSASLGCSDGQLFPRALLTFSCNSFMLQVALRIFSVLSSRERYGFQLNKNN